MNEKKEAHDRVLDIVVGKDEVTWQALVYDLFRKENMDPWDADVSKLTKTYIQMLKRMKKVDFRIGGKVILAAAILLGMKAKKLQREDIPELGRIMSPDPEMTSEEFYDGLEQASQAIGEDIPPLMPRTPQPRKRKVSIYDLMLALNKALEVRDRRVLRQTPAVKIEMPEKKVDMSGLINSLHQTLSAHFSSGRKITFGQVTGDMDRTRKVHNFLAMLHLANIDQRKIDLLQNEHFGEIEIARADPEATRAAQKEQAKIRKQESAPAEKERKKSSAS